ncbi:Tetratricopeptide repeat-containing protein [Malonomonas rubra DSM 5091]|uniref:Tetratricopeptide repeat-containing protein n=2 Tax=Malonomonas rubra TaxID=57040 RepID=A0A1M6KCG5_MALRU|nr:Tetratricopeptide repeat-containing protein [Malonomonas rubra DSM 5091]
MLNKSFIVVIVFFLLAQFAPVDAITRQQYAHNLASLAEKMSKQEGKEFLAISYINEAIKAQPSNLGMYYKRAAIYSRAGLNAEAIKDLNLILKNDPLGKKFPSTLKYRAECFAALGSYQKALSDYQTFLRKAPKSGKVWYYYAELLWFVGDREKALQAINSGLRTGSHWEKKMRSLQTKILDNKKVKLHKPFSN